MHVDRPGDPHPTLAAIATFRSCEQSVFGYPNDEAYWAVEDAGYGFYEVLESDWDDRLDVLAALTPTLDQAITVAAGGRS